jgi:hypothetical protein
MPVVRPTDIGHQSATRLRLTGREVVQRGGRGGMIGQAQSEPGQLLERGREIRALCREIADVRARDELLRIAAEYELIAEAMRFWARHVGNISRSDGSCLPM